MHTTNRDLLAKLIIACIATATWALKQQELDAEQAYDKVLEVGQAKWEQLKHEGVRL